MLAEHRRTFELFGSRVRLLIGASAPGPREPGELANEIEIAFRLVHRALSRFDPDSELSSLNADRRDTVPASSLMIGFVEAAIGAAEVTDGLIDPTLIDELERCGYRDSRAGVLPAPLTEAFAWAPRRRPAQPGRRRWRLVAADRGSMTIRRPPGIRLDSGGIGKGLAADIGASRLRDCESFVVDCGGDMRIGGTLGLARPVEVADPFGRRLAARFELAAGAIATSGLATRIWRRPDGSFAHHLIDPSTGDPAWTGLAQATAAAATGVEAETLAKAALLAGPEGAREILAVRGGVLITADGSTEVVGPIAPPVGAEAARAA
jgi:thiamine biosynthesis lipoprotein